MEEHPLTVADLEQIAGPSWRGWLAGYLSANHDALVASMRAHAVAMPGRCWLVRQALALALAYAGPLVLDVVISALSAGSATDSTPVAG